MVGQAIEPQRDPYRRCERGCQHDLARGVSIAELFGEDGPHDDPRRVLDPHPRLVGPQVLLRPTA